jgi:hypothetical protein
MTAATTAARAGPGCLADGQGPATGERSGAITRGRQSGLPGASSPARPRSAAAAGSGAIPGRPAEAA